MKDISKVLNDQWSNKAKEEAKKYDKMKKPEQTKWTQDFLKFNMKAWTDVLDNANECAGKVTKMKESVKDYIDKFEAMIKNLREGKKKMPLTDKDRDFLEAGKKEIEGALDTVKFVRTDFSKNSPAIPYRGEYFADFVKAKAITSSIVDKIKEVRKQGIDISNDFGKSGGSAARIEEYSKRWDILEKELEGLQKQAGGKAQDWAADVSKQLKAFTEGAAKWDEDLKLAIGKITRNIEGVVGKGMVQEAPKKFGESLKEAIKKKLTSKEVLQAKAEHTASTEILGLNTYVSSMSEFLKKARGMMKTRLMEFKSLEASFANAGEYAEPQRKALETIGKKMSEQQITLDQLAKAVDEAGVMAKAVVEKQKEAMEKAKSKK